MKGARNPDYFDKKERIFLSGFSPDGPVSIALQVPGGERLQCEFKPSHTLWL